MLLAVDICKKLLPFIKCEGCFHICPKGGINNSMNNSRDIFWEEIEDKSFEGQLKNKNAIVTGGASGIGKAISKRFFQQGWNVAVVDIDDSARKHIGKNCNLYINCDVRHENQVKDAVEKTVDEFEGLNVIVNCAGCAWLTPISEESEEFFDKIIDTNFKGVRNFTKAAQKYLSDSGGDIINIGSIWGLPGVNLPGDSTYSAGDAAIIKYSEVAAEEIDEIDINCISPSLVDTPMNKDMTEEQKENVVERFSNRSNMLYPSEIAEVAEFLVKNDITQKNLIIGADLEKIRNRNLQ